MALFADVAMVAEALASEGSRLKKRAAIAEAVGRIAAADGAAEAGRFCLYLAGQPFAEADPRKLNAGGAILSRAVREVSGATDVALTAAYRRHGDLGAAAYDLLVAPYGKAPAEGVLTLDEVAEAFEAMAGARTTAARAATVEGLLRRATALEAKYLLKLMLGDMRIGVKQSLVEEAIGVAATTSGASAGVAEVRHAVMLEADLSAAVVRAFAGTLGEARMRLFHPLGFMLASPVETPEEAVERFSEKPKVEKKEKPKRRKKGGPEAVVAEDAAEEGLAEDVEAEAGMGGGDEAGPPLSAKDDNSVGSAEGAVTPAIHALLEDKYDGMRAQVHLGDPSQPGRVGIYSRNREDVTHSFPELEEAFRGVRAPEGLSGGYILDGEIMGWDLAADKALPFAILGQRIGRKRVDNDLRRAIPVLFMAFDLLFADGELLLPLPLRERRARLEAVVGKLQEVTAAPIDRDEAAQGGQGGLFGGTLGGSDEGNAAEAAVQRLRISPARLVEDAEAIDAAYREARARANEGVMLKAAGSPYLPGRRGLLWVKLKRELATLDVVITGAEFGHGRRARLLSDYTFAVRGDDGELLNVGKAYSGVTDAEILELTEWLKAHTLEDFGHFRTVEPIRVLEVAFNNVMRSDRHSSGFALRFPRILRVRDDKPVEEIDTLARVEEIYRSQPDKPEEVDEE
jgi:DNA ligase 1